MRDVWEGVFPEDGIRLCPAELEKRDIPKWCNFGICLRLKWSIESFEIVLFWPFHLYAHTALPFL